MPSLCRDCLTMDTRDHPGPSGPRCAHCSSPRVVAHPELFSLAVAHIDCDAFYATVEKRDDPSLSDKPVLVGGRQRGVVMAACYVARLYGCRSAMPMFKALKACPDAVVIAPDMAKYREVGLEVRRLMQDLTPLVEPLSIDEAFLDLRGTEALHGGPPALTLARFARRLEEELRLTASIGLSHNKFLAKIASDLDKPRGFAVVGRQETLAFLADKPVGIIWGVGKALQRRLARDGVRSIRDLRGLEEETLAKRYGAMGTRLYRLARGQDSREVNPDAPSKSISAETTFNEDLSDFNALKSRLWPLCETVSRRLKRADLAGGSVTLKLKTRDFRILTRSRKLQAPTQIAEELFRQASGLLEPEADGEAYRLIGVGCSDLGPGSFADPPDLLDPGKARRAEVERAIDRVRAKLGPDAIKKGRALPAKPPTR